jgi:hypothetical protein
LIGPAGSEVGGDGCGVCVKTVRTGRRRARMTHGVRNREGRRTGSSGPVKSISISN